MWRLIHEVQLGRACDSLRHQLEKEITYGVNAQVKADSVIEAQQRQIVLRDEAAKVQSDRIINQTQANQELRKEVRNNNKLTVVSGAASVVTAAVGGPAVLVAFFAIVPIIKRVL